MAHPHAFDALEGVFADGPADDDAQLGFETLARQRKQVLGGWAAGLDEVVLGRPGEVQDLVIAVDHNAGQTKPAQQGVLRQLRQPGRSLRPAGRLRHGWTWLRLHHRELQVGRPSRANAPVNPPFLGDRLEQVGLPANRLRRAQEQVASLFESEVQEGDDLLLHLRFEVDQEVAATDQVHLGKGGVGDQVLHRKRHGFAHLFADLPGGFVHPREEAGQPFRGDIGGDALGIDALAGDLQGLFIDIRGEDLQAARVLRRRLLFEQQHGDGVSLLAGGAAGDPDAQGRVGTPWPG